MVMFIPPAYVVYCSLVQYIEYGTWILENVCECYMDMMILSGKRIITEMTTIVYVIWHLVQGNLILSHNQLGVLPWMTREY